VVKVVIQNQLALQQELSVLLFTPVGYYP